MVKFVSYDGEFPNLCSGTLVLELDGKQYSASHVLCSGGSVRFTEDYDEVVTQGAWRIHEYELPDELQSHIEEITDLVNFNVKWGCCGGCV